MLTTSSVGRSNLVGFSIKKLLLKEPYLPHVQAHRWRSAPSRHISPPNNHQDTAENNQPEVDSEPKRLLSVAIIGSPNAGKSTLLNRLIDCELSSTSRRAHTTRRNILGVYTSPDRTTQLEFFDSPGLIDRKHMIRHHLESTLYYDPQLACDQCNLIALVVDATDSRETRRLNKGSMDLLRKFPAADKVLILNKTDLVKDKRTLLDIATRLTQGCLEGRLTLDERNLKYIKHEQLRELNLTGHKEAGYSPQYDSSLPAREPVARGSTSHKYVIDLKLLEEQTRREAEGNGREEEEKEASEPATTTMDRYESRLEHALDPDRIGYPNFSRIFSISALKNDSVDQLRQYLISSARPVAEFRHRPEFLTTESFKDIAMSIIKANMMDLVDGHAPFSVSYSCDNSRWDEYSSLHLSVRIHCQNRYLIKKVLGKSGVTINKVVEQSRELISKVFACEVNLAISVVLSDKP